MAFGISRRTNRASSSGKSLSDLYDDARTEALADQPLDRIRQEIFVEMAELQERLQSWIATLNARDIARLKGFYAPTMSAFYRARHVSREFALADKADQFRRAEVLNVRADAADIALPPDGQSAALTFRKRYEIRGGGLNRVGEVVSELRWAKGASGWMITSERDLEIR